MNHTIALPVCSLCVLTSTDSPLPPAEVTVGHVEGAVSILKKYIAMLHKHASHVLPLATQVASLSPLHFSTALAILTCGPCGLVIPELAVEIVLLILRVPLQLMESDCIPLLGELVEVLDTFNRLAPEARQEDREDLSWTGSMFSPMYTAQGSSHACSLQLVTKILDISVPDTYQ